MKFYLTKITYSDLHNLTKNLAILVDFVCQNVCYTLCSFFGIFK